MMIGRSALLSASCGGPDGPAVWSICCQYAVVVVWFNHLVIDSVVRWSMKSFRNRRFAASRQPKAADHVAGRWQRGGGDAIDRCRPHDLASSSPLIRHSDELPCGTG